MAAQIWRACLRSLAAGGAAGGVFAGYLLLQGSLADQWDQVALAGILVGVTAAVILLTVPLRYRRAIQAMGAHLEHFRERPSNAPLETLLPAGTEDLGNVLGPVEKLCAAYRHVLADRVAQDHALESLRRFVGQMETEQGQRLTVRAGGSSRNMVARLTPNLFWMTATPALQQFLRCKMSNLNGKPFAEVVHPEDMGYVKRIFEEALETGEAHNITLRVLPRTSRRAGPQALKERYVNLDVLTRYRDDGKPLHLRCYFVDITDRVLAEQELRRRTQELSLTNERLRRSNEDLERLKESYRDLYHHAPAMYFSLDARGHFVTFNETLLRGLGYQRSDLWKQPYTRLLPPPLRGAWETGANGMAGFPPALTEEGEVETQWVKKDGTVIDMWIRSVPVRDDLGRFVRSRSAAQDVTERNRLANELRSRRDELERANVDLRLINRELEEFTSVVSHDLKEPLRTLQAFSGFLAEDYSGQLGPDGFQYINHLVQASRRLGMLIDDLLTLSSAGRITHEVDTFNLIEIVATVRRDLADLLQRREAELVVQGSLPWVAGDPQRIVQLLANLVGNGLKYNTSPRPQVIIGQVAEPNGSSGKKAPGQVTVYVRDNGIGIDPRYHEQIFGIFRRLHQPEEYEGTGAGLAICKKIVEAHAGRIWVDSEPGQGATFYFTLPRASPESEEVTEPGSEEADAAERAVRDTSIDSADLPGANGTTADRPKEAPRVLLVEDMSEMAMIAEKLAHRGGHELVWLQTAEEAWEYLHNERPDLVLLDIHLPGMSGVDLCRKIRSDPQLQDLPIALFTQGTEDSSWSADIGADFVLSKDLLAQPEAWLRRLDEMLTALPRVDEPEQTTAQDGTATVHVPEIS